MKRLSMFIFLVAAMTASHLFGGIKDKLGLGLNINAHKLYGDTRSGSLGLSGGNLLLRYRLKPALFLEPELGFLRLSTQTNGASLDTDMLNLGAKAGYTFLTSQKYQPYVYFGIGALNYGKIKFLFEVSPLATFRFWDGYVALGAGTEFFASTSLAVNVTADFRYTSGDGFDGRFDGSRKDGYLNLGLGFIYHFDRHSNQGTLSSRRFFLNPTLCMLKSPRPMVKKKQRAWLNRLIRNWRMIFCLSRRQQGKLWFIQCSRMTACIKLPQSFTGISWPMQKS